ncbi:MAG: mechanosensitive ion channel family protein [Flavobacteriales bacterium]|nr:mechanosensitive ion channel family protein [Flavobacteriales bacterium]
MFVSVVIIITTWVIRNWVVSLIRGEDNFISEVQRRWMARVKNGAFLIIISTLFILWRYEINEFALSLTALAVAIVIASKEIILCITGSIQRASAHAFVIGDWIEVNQISGEVIDYNIMSTQIQEIDLKYKTYVYTGKTISFPNSLFFTYPVKNLNFMKRYVYHEFNITIKENVNLFLIEDELYEKIDAHCEEFKDVASRYNQMIERHAGVDLPGAEAHSMIITTSLGDQQVHIRLFCPTELASDLEHQIRRDFAFMYARLLQ